MAITLEVREGFFGLYDVCAHAKNFHHCPHGLFQSSPVHVSPWFRISMDFIVDLPRSTSFDSILGVVDCLMKMVHFIPCNKSIIGKKTVKLFLDHVFCYHGFPKDIISDCGPQFTSKFWKWLFEQLNVKVKLSLAFHP